MQYTWILEDLVVRHMSNHKFIYAKLCSTLVALYDFQISFEWIQNLEKNTLNTFLKIAVQPGDTLLAIQAPCGTQLEVPRPEMVCTGFLFT